MKRSLAAATWAAALVLVLPEEANANGRFPEATQLLFPPSDQIFIDGKSVSRPPASQNRNTIVLRVTFGLLVSHDRGKTWRWVCEQAIGFSGVEDPMYTITPSGNLIGTTAQGLTLAKNNACAWQFAGGPLAGEFFIDLTWRTTDPRDVLALSSAFSHLDDAGAIFFRSRLFQTKDEGESFVELPAILDPTLLGYTVDYATSDPLRIYLTATRDPSTVPVGVLLTSRDGGSTFTETAIPLEGSERYLFIAAVDPNDANTVYVRTAGGSDKPSRLLLTEDGGATFREIFRTPVPMQGFALSKDGSRVYVGGPRVSIQGPDPNVPPETKLGGLFVANARTQAGSLPRFQFQRLSTIDIHCLNVQDDGLWACSNEANGGFILGRSADDGKTFTPTLHFCDVEDALSCPAGTAVADVCAPGWPAQRQFLGCDLGGDAGPDAGGPAPLTLAGGACTTVQGSSSTLASLLPLGVGAILVAARLRRRRSR